MCKPHCIKPLLAYQACAKRIEAKHNGHCTGQYFDYWCVAAAPCSASVCISHACSHLQELRGQVCSSEDLCNTQVAAR